MEPPDLREPPSLLPVTPPAIIRKVDAYDTLYARIMAGETVIVDSLPGKPAGKYRCFLENGKPVFRKEATVDADGAPTPQAEITRVLALLPTPKIGFVDLGCGADARWCIAAAEKWGCKATGVEIDPARAAAAKERVKAAGLGHLVTIIEGDAVTTEVAADVGVAYLWSDVLVKLKPRIEKLAAFASYQHRVPGLAMAQNGDSFIYTKPVAVAGPPVAYWNGQAYTGPLCNSSSCSMCNEIRRSLAAQQAQQPQQSTSGQWVKHCNNGVCFYTWESFK